MREVRGKEERRGEVRTFSPTVETVKWSYRLSSYLLVQFPTLCHLPHNLDCPGGEKSSW